MPNDVDFHAIGEAYVEMLKAGLASQGLGYKAVLFEPDQLDLRMDNTPLISVTLGEGASQPRAAGSYYDRFNMTVEVAVIDLSNWATAAKGRTALFRACRGLTRTNPRFHADVNEAQLGGYEFERAVDTQESNWFAAIARFEVIVGVYYDR